MTTNTAVFLVQKTVSGGVPMVVDIGKLKDVSVQVIRTGSTDTVNIEVSNNGTNWSTAHSRLIDTGTGDHKVLSGISNTTKLPTLLEIARYVRINPSGATDSFAVTICAPAARG